MLSQCLGGSFLSADTEQEDREKGTLGCTEENSASGNVTELEKLKKKSGSMADITVNLKLRFISCFMSLQFNQWMLCYHEIIFPYLINFNVTEILYSL